MKKQTLTILALFGVWGSVFSQDSQGNAEKPPLPPGPLLKRIADLSTWKVSYVYPQDQSKSDIKPYDSLPWSKDLSLPAPTRSITILVAKPKWLATTVDVKGNQLVQCSDGVADYCYVSTTKAVGTLPYDQSGNPPANLINFQRADFPDLDWISPATYVTLKKTESGGYMIFQKDDMTAWIDLETRWPIQWQKGKEIRKFRQLPPSPAIVFPPEIEELAKLVRKDMERFAPATAK